MGYRTPKKGRGIPQRAQIPPRSAGSGKPVPGARETGKGPKSDAYNEFRIKVNLEEGDQRRKDYVWKRRVLDIYHEHKLYEEKAQKSKKDKVKNSKEASQLFEGFALNLVEDGLFTKEVPTAGVRQLLANLEKQTYKKWKTKRETSGEGAFNQENGEEELFQVRLLDL
jgi:hypothetical protein